MNRLTRHLLLPVVAAAALCALTACGGGGADDRGSPAPTTPTTPTTPTPPAAPAAQTISFAAPATQAFGTAPPDLVATASSGLVVSFASTTPAVCTVNGTVLTLVATGTCTVSASQAGNAAYAAAAPVSNSWTVAPGAQTISFISPGNQTLGSPAPALTATASSALPVVFASTTPAVCSVNGVTLTLVAPGACTLSANQAGNGNYAAAAPVLDTFTVASAPLIAQTVAFNALANRTFGDAPIALSASASSGLVVAFASTTPAVCTVAGTTLTLAGAGLCTVAASQAGSATYSAASNVSQSFTVAPTAQTISFVSPGNQTIGTAPAPMVATASSGLTVALTSGTPGVCTVSGTALSLVAAGTCTVNANQAGNANVAPAPAVAQTFTVSPTPLLAQTITFASPGSQTIGVTPAALTASASSGLAVAFASTTPAVCTVGGTTLTLVAAGSCTVVASQNGNATYAAAALVPNTFAVAAAPVIELMANGGFETAATLANQFSKGWRGTNSRPATLATDARTGASASALAVPDPGFGGSGLVQNAVDDGGQPSILGQYVGKTTLLSFWAKGNASVTGNVNYSLRYLDSTGNILNTVVNTSFQGLINPNTWTRITYSGPAIPAQTSAIFLEMTLAVGPTGVQPPGNCGVDPLTGAPNPCDNGQARVLIDDVSVQIVP